MAEEVELYAELDRDNLAPDAHNQQICVRLMVGPSEQFARDHPQADCHVLLVLDASGSMDEPFSADHAGMTKRQGVIAACNALLPELHAQDRIGVVAFGTRANFLLRDAEGSRPENIESAVEQLRERMGMTNFEAAFNCISAWAAEHPQGSRRVLFLTDGRPTTGSWDQVETMNAALARQGVVVDCMGVGTGFAFDQMQALSGPTNGRTEMLVSPDQSQSLFRDMLGTAHRSQIHNVLMRLRVPANRNDLEIYQTVPENRYHQSVQRNPDGSADHMVNIGSLSQLTQHRFMISMRVTPDAGAANLELLRSRLDYSIPVLQIDRGQIEDVVRINVGGREVVDGTVTEEYHAASLMKHELEFRGLVDQDYRRAAKVLAAMRDIAQTACPEKVATYEEFHEELMKTHKLTRDQLNRLFRVSSRTPVETAAQASARQASDDLKAPF